MHLKICIIKFIIINHQFFYLALFSDVQALIQFILCRICSNYHRNRNASYLHVANSWPVTKLVLHLVLLYIE